jgi:hypothetical protein
MALYRVLYTINYKNGDASPVLTETIDAPDDAEHSIRATVLKLEQEREHYCPIQSVRIRMVEAV